MSLNDPAPRAEDTPLLPGPDPAPVHHASATYRLRNYFLTGLVVAGPLAITVYLTWSFITWVDNLVRPFIPVAYRPETYLPWSIPGTGLVIAFFAITMLGFLTANLVGRTLVEAGETLLDRMPLVRSIYKGLKQVFETLFSESGSSFRKVALVEFPAPGMWSLVFLSQPPSGEITGRLPLQDAYVSAFMPCTPNPTTGFFFYVPKRGVIELDIPVEAAAKLIMTAGLIQPNGGADTQKKLQAMADTARAAQAMRKAEPVGTEGASASIARRAQHAEAISAIRAGCLRSPKARRGGSQWLELCDQKINRGGHHAPIKQARRVGRHPDGFTCRFVIRLGAGLDFPREALPLALRRGGRARRRQPADAAERARRRQADPRGEDLRARKNPRPHHPDVAGAQLRAQYAAHLGAERPQPAGRQRGDRVHRARPDGHAVRRARAPAARPASLQLHRGRAGGTAHGLHKTRRREGGFVLRPRRAPGHRRAQGRRH